MKYLAIKNWHKYQSADLTQYCPWIRTYVNKDQDYGFSHLTMLQRYLLEGCCRLRSRVGHNIPNDPQWIARGPDDSAAGETVCKKRHQGDHCLWISYTHRPRRRR